MKTKKIYYFVSALTLLLAVIGLIKSRNIDQQVQNYCVAKNAAQNPDKILNPAAPLLIFFIIGFSINLITDVNIIYHRSLNKNSKYANNFFEKKGQQSIKTIFNFVMFALAVITLFMVSRNFWRAFMDIQLGQIDGVDENYEEQILIKKQFYSILGICFLIYSLSESIKCLLLHVY